MTNHNPKNPRSAVTINLRNILLVILLATVVTGCARSIEHVRRKPSEDSPPGKVVYGVASWYGKKFHGRTTASGERFDMYAYTAAHRTLPFGSRVRVTNLSNGLHVVVRINDRGPWIKGREIDLSYIAARDLRMLEAGLQKVRLEILSG